MKRRDFLRTTISTAAVAAISPLALIEPAKNFTGSVGAIDGINVIEPQRAYDLAVSRYLQYMRKMDREHFAFGLRLADDKRFYS